jgi:hypothetical protein
MFRKLVLAATLALGLGGGVVATQSAEAAVVHPAASATVIQAIEQSAPAATGAQQVHYRPYYHRHGYYGHRRVCSVRRVRVRTHYGWRWTTRRVCWWR